MIEKRNSRDADLMALAFNLGYKSKKAWPTCISQKANLSYHLGATTLAIEDHNK